MKITKQKYEAAIKVIEAYQKQLEQELAEVKAKRKVVEKIETQLSEMDMPIGEWIRSKDISVRAYNALRSEPLYDIKVKDLTLEIFKKARNAGAKSWAEFVEARGF